MKKPNNSMRPSLTRISKLHIFVSLVLAAQIILYDAGKVITPDVVLKRWSVTAILAIVSTACWYLARIKNGPQVAHRLVWALVTIDMFVAAFTVYTQRGMASRGVILFILPILTAAVLRRKGMIYLTTILAIVTYVLTAIAYFVLNFNEGYKIELYGELSFYSGILLIVGAMSWSLVRTKH
jgi:hypothetical protein